MKILCRTLFDCSRTGTTGHFRVLQGPFQDALGTVIDNQSTWTRSRNQQRNFETILQMISLRAQPTVISDPKEHHGEWSFEFEVETPGVYSSTGSADDTSALLQECQGTPMIIGLGETRVTVSYLNVQNTDQNIWFETINNS
jgi:hypothetical protein